METRTYAVEGMTCGHCVKSIEAAVGRIGGVTRASVDLAARTVTVAGAVLDDEAVQAAVEDAGYRTVS